VHLFRRKCISCKPLHMLHLICFCCTHRRISQLRSTHLVTRSRITSSRILCSRKWIPSVLFSREARVLLDIVTSRRTFRRWDGYMCLILHVCGMSWLTGWIHLHFVQKASASQQLPLVMEKAGGKRASSFSPSANPSTRQTRSTQKIKIRTLFSFS
jgi:hypothetical protein